MRDGFQQCEIDTYGGSEAPRWENKIVVLSLIVHVVDVGLDLCVLALFLNHGQWSFLIGSVCVVLWAWIVASLYVVFGGDTSGAASADIDDGPSWTPSGPGGLLGKLLRNFVQVRIFTEAQNCLQHGGDTDYFHTLRLLEAILQSAPNAVLQLYAMVYWVAHAAEPITEIGVDSVSEIVAELQHDAMPESAVSLLRASALSSFVSVGLGLAMWEQKVQFRTSTSYIGAVGVMRFFEIASRSSSMAVFSAVTHPYGFFWVLLLDYAAMLVLIVHHRSVQLTYGLVVALPLVLVSLEPLVWRREDHAVPKDAYYTVRVVEFVIMWIVIAQGHPMLPGFPGTVWFGCESLALVSTLGLYATLPFVFMTARKHELSRDSADWTDEAHQGLAQDGGGYYSDSQDGSDQESGALRPSEPGE
eukprot:TRINITY_DN110807_c0_g1_i1.p1 TRINITY_DN110807_c0_g1~~TRINITY_DN110807_c0_g1_i1.p1  ORF type:complete len:415 (+),score=75.83 TRINITY_DN110807_c0_g1_i1:195-1439(+)